MHEVEGDIRARITKSSRIAVQSQWALYGKTIAGVELESKSNQLQLEPVTGFIGYFMYLDGKWQPLTTELLGKARCRFA